MCALSTKVLRQGGPSACNMKQGRNAALAHGTLVGLWHVSFYGRECGTVNPQAPHPYPSPHRPPPSDFRRGKLGRGKFPWARFTPGGARSSLARGYSQVIPSGFQGGKWTFTEANKGNEGLRDLRRNVRDGGDSVLTHGLLFLAIVGDEIELRPCDAFELGGAFRAGKVVADAEGVTLKFVDRGVGLAFVWSFGAGDSHALGFAGGIERVSALVGFSSGQDVILTVVEVQADAL